MSSSRRSLRVDLGLWSTALSSTSLTTTNVMGTRWTPSSGSPPELVARVATGAAVKRRRHSSTSSRGTSPSCRIAGRLHAMATWDEIEAAAPETAGLARARFEATGLGMLATLRADGAPRISGIEPTFLEGEVWLGMMDGSLKAKDLQRDPRFSLHAATADKEVKEGDAKLAGRAVEVLDHDAKVAFMRRLAELNGYGPPEDDPYHLFRLDITEVVTIKPAGDHLDIDTWTAAKGVTHVDRH